jgi:hypothetical protein
MMQASARARPILPRCAAITDLLVESNCRIPLEGISLTYKSIRAAIKRHVHTGRLHALDMTDASAPVERVLVFADPIKTLLEGPWTHPSFASRAGRLRADLEAFVRGDPVSVCLRPYEAGAAFFGRLAEPEDEVWDVRAREPNPALRLFGRFAAPDHFVAFDWRPRSKTWNGREPLGDRNDPEWNVEKSKCTSRWVTLFPKHEPIHGGTVHDYVTSNALSV